MFSFIYFFDSSSQTTRVLSEVFVNCRVIRADEDMT
jgi:hypothetical protein